MIWQMAGYRYKNTKLIICYESTHHLGAEDTPRPRHCAFAYFSFYVFLHFFTNNLLDLLSFAFPYSHKFGSIDSAQKEDNDLSRSSNTVAQEQDDLLLCKNIKAPL